MKVYLCVDNTGGMMFNNRRQSRDKEVIKDILNDSTGNLFIGKYSESLFLENENAYTISDDMLNQAGPDDSCFVENLSLKNFLDKTSELVIYCWNRDYPTDFYLDFNPESEGFKLVSQIEFTGSSHEKITKFVYNK